jgi:5-methylcytosine-specific restriction enzyme subunit McrC
MKAHKNIIQVFEHQKIKIDHEDIFKDHHFKALENYGYRTREKYFSVGNGNIKFSNYVGVIQVKNLTIEILPKADNGDNKEKWQNALLDILKECKLIRLESITNAHLKLKNSSILDLYYDVFLRETENLVRHGLVKSYRNQKQNLNKVKGKILFTEHINKNFIHKERFYVEYKIYDQNTLLNQILRKALIILSNMVNSPEFQIRIKRLLFEFENIEEVIMKELAFDLIMYNRNTERYRKAINIAKLIILQYTPDLKGGNENVLAILFDMNQLFERFIFGRLKNRESQNIKVYKKYRKFWGNRPLKPDIIVSNYVKKYIIDTKWKVLSACNPSIQDLRQVYVYNHYYESKKSILLYPNVNDLSHDSKPFHKSYFNKHGIEEFHECQLGFIDLFDGNKIRKEIADDILQFLN